MPSSPNQLLASLSTSDFGMLEPNLQSLALRLRQDLELPNKRIDAVYFPHSGFASVVAIQSAKKQVEIGLIGREGMSGLSVVLGNHRSPHATYIQSAGDRQSIRANDLRKAMDASATLRNFLLKYVQAFGVQTTHTAICNAQSKLDQRLARWVLMAHDTHRCRSFAADARIPVANACCPPGRRNPGDHCAEKPRSHKQRERRHHNSQPQGSGAHRGRDIWNSGIRIPPADRLGWRNPVVTGGRGALNCRLPRSPGPDTILKIRFPIPRPEGVR